MRIPSALKMLARLLFVVFVICGILLPLYQIFKTALSTEKGISILFSHEVLFVLVMTLKQSFLSTALSLAIGFLISSIWKKETAHFDFLLRIPFLLPTLVVANTSLQYLGGLFGVRYSLLAVVLTHAWINAPWVAYQLIQSRRQIPITQIEAARTLGGNRFQIFSRIEFPYFFATLTSVGVQVFSLCVSSFSIVLLLGGGPPVETLETAIYSQLRLSGIQLGAASAYALWQLIFGLIAMSILTWGNLKFKNRLEIGAPALGFHGRKNVSPVSHLLFGIAVFFLFLLVAPFFWDSLSHLNSLRDYASELVIPVAMSLKIGFLSALMSVAWVSVVFISGLRWASFWAQLPSGISILVFGLGFWLTYESYIDLFDGSIVMIALLQSILGLPLGYRILSPLVANLQRVELEAALTLGAGPVKAFFEIEWPRFKAPLIGFFKMAFVMSLGELAAASLFQSTRVMPLSVWMSEQLLRYRFEASHAGVTIILLLVLFFSGVLNPSIWSKFGQNKRI